MHRLDSRFIPGLALVALLAAGCGTAATPDTRTIQTQVAASIFATQTADVPTPTLTLYPTNTPQPTYTPYPTLTPYPTVAPPMAIPTPPATLAPTIVVTVTLVPVPTATLRPTSIPVPTAMPAPSLSVASFVIVSFQSKWDYGYLKIIGELKNVGTVGAGAQIEVIARDANGVLVDSSQFWPNSINNIPPGGTCGISYSITKNTAAVTLEAKVISVTVWK
jgi:hypothetical protein